MIKELINIEKLNNKIEALDESYIECIFQQFYLPLAIEALKKEIEERDDLGEDGLKARTDMIKQHELTLKSTQGTIEHLEKTIPFLNSLK